MNELMLYIIMVLHFIFLLFVILTPFVGNNYFLLLHGIMVPFMMAHWYSNDNTCALTLMENKIRKILYGIDPDPNDCFTYNLIAPVYEFKKNNNDISSMIYIITIVLWGFTVLRLYTNYKNGKLSKIQDLTMY